MNPISTWNGDLIEKSFNPKLIKEITLHEVSEFFDLHENFFHVIKVENRNKFDFIFSFDKNKFQSVKMFMYYVWDLFDQIDNVIIELEENNFTSSYFSKWLFDHKYTTYRNAFWDHNKSAFYKHLEYNVKDYTSIKFDIIKRNGIIFNYLKGYLEFKKDILNKDISKIYITKDKKNKIIEKWKLPFYIEKGYITGKYQKERKCPVCGQVGIGTNMTRYHFTNCKKGKEYENNSR